MENKVEVKEQKEFREERFEFALYVNNNLICKRNFKINNYIDESMQSLDFKNTVDQIVHMIDCDLKSKSRVYTWYYYDQKNPDEEFTEPLIEPWECTFKFVVSDNKQPVITKIWDGYGYPKAIRDKVDIANKTVKITNKDGKTYVYDKETYFEANKDRLSPELYVLKAQIMDKPDLLIAITKKICETRKRYTLPRVYISVKVIKILLTLRKPGIPRGGLRSGSIFMRILRRCSGRGSHIGRVIKFAYVTDLHRYLLRNTVAFALAN